MRVLLYGLCVAALASCKVNLQSAQQDAAGRACTVSSAAVCEQAGTDLPSDFAWLQQNMFSTNCSGSDCHGAPTGSTPPSGNLSFAAGFTYKALLGKEPGDPGMPLVLSSYDPGFHLVEPGKPNESYLLYLLQGLEPSENGKFALPPDDVGFMPQNNRTLCCQKLDVVARWIEAGANP